MRGRRERGWADLRGPGPESEGRRCGGVSRHGLGGGARGAVVLVGAGTREVSQRKAGTRRALCHLVFILFCFNICIDF